MHKLEFHPGVSKDFLQAATYFENISNHQLLRFLNELKSAYQKIKEHPTHYLVLLKKRKVRRVSLKGFEYSVIYKVRQDSVLVLAIKHHKQREYWKKRK